MSTNILYFGNLIWYSKKTTYVCIKKIALLLHSLATKGSKAQVQLLNCCIMTKVGNPLQKFFEAKDKQKTILKAREQFSFQLFSDRYAGIYRISKAFRFCFHAFSITTAILFLAYLLDGIIYQFFLSVLTAACVHMGKCASATFAKASECFWYP